MNEKTNKFLCKHIPTNDDGDITLGGVVAETCARLFCVGVLAGVVIFIGTLFNWIVLDSVIIHEFSIDAFICFFLMGIGVIIIIALTFVGGIGIIMALDKLLSIKLAHCDVKKKDEVEEDEHGKSSSENELDVK